MAGLMIFALSFGVRALYRVPITGTSGLVGQTAVVRTPLAPEGQVAVHGELWRAVAQDGPIAAGEPVTIVGVDGLTLTVARGAAASGR
jgi:membrane-bound serine protease (ClpP class)